MGIVEAATELFGLLAAQDTTFTKHLLPGLSRNQIHALVSPLGITLPEEAVQFYEHFNLPQGAEYGANQPAFFGMYRMLGLENAVGEHYSQNFPEFCADYPDYEEYEGSDKWFPFLQESSYLYLLDTSKTVGDACPVVHCPEAGQTEIAFISLTAMFATMVDWIKEGALAIEDGHLPGAYDSNPVQVGTIALRHNPGVESWQRWFLERGKIT